jgi:hypothetical protein
MKKLLLTLIFIFAFAGWAFAAPVNITCDPQVGVDEYNIFINGNQVATSTAIVDVESGLYYLLFDLKTLNLADGAYIATATAVNKWGESALSNECPFTKVIPNSPQNLRIPASGE